MTEPKPSNQQKLAKNTIMVHPTRKNHHNQNSSYLHSQPHKHTHKKGIQAQAAGTHKQQTPQHNHHKNSGRKMPWRMKKTLKKVHWHTIEFSNNTTTTTKPHKTVQPAAVATRSNLHTFLLKHKSGPERLFFKPPDRPDNLCFESKQRLVDRRKN